MEKVMANVAKVASPRLYTPSEVLEEPVKVPFTPYHLGPAFLIDAIASRKLDQYMLAVSSIALDLEGFLVLTLGLRYPLHGYAHTYLAATLAALALTFAAVSVRRLTGGRLKLLIGGEMRLVPILASALLGLWLHVSLDAPLYPDIRPFYPIQLNPLYDPSPSSYIDIYIYDACALSFPLALIAYGLRMLIRRFAKD